MITSNMNKRIRQKRLAPKEFLVRWSMDDHKPIHIHDTTEGISQYDRRQYNNEKSYSLQSQRYNTPVISKFEIGSSSSEI